VSVVTKADFAVRTGAELAGRTKTSIRLEFVPLRVRRGRLEIQVRPGDAGWRLWSFAPRADQVLTREATRLAEGELGLPGSSVQLGAFGTPNSGLTAVFIHLVRPFEGKTPRPELTLRSSWKDIRGVQLAPEARLVVAHARARVEHDVEHGAAGFLLVGDEFTVSELRHVHEAARGLEIDPSNFRKRVSRWVDDGVVNDIEKMRSTATRPARLFAVNSEVLVPPHPGEAITIRAFAFPGESG
jgi:8-oxo-dGTP diphosphatase